MKDRLLQILLALDQLANALLGGWADETISARTWRQRHKRRFAIALRFIDGLFGVLGQKDHCRQAYESEKLRTQLPAEFR